MNYRAQARQLRSETRTHLASLRRERIERRQSLQLQAKHSSAARADREDTQLTEQVIAPELMLDVSADVDGLIEAPDDINAAVDVAEVDIAEVEAAENVLNFTPSRAVQNSIEAAAVSASQDEQASHHEALHQEWEADLANADQHIQQVTPEVHNVAKTEPSFAGLEAMPDQESLALRPASIHGVYDLERLPTIGPGQIWHLQQAGVFSLDDLAHTDIDQLAVRLGSISRLMRLRDWLSLSRSVAV